MGKEYLIDTYTVIDYMGNKLPEKAKPLIPKIFQISKILRLLILIRIYNTEN